MTILINYIVISGNIVGLYWEYSGIMLGLCWEHFGNMGNEFHDEGTTGIRMRMELCWEYSGNRIVD